MQPVKSAVPQVAALVRGRADHLRLIDEEEVLVLFFFVKATRADDQKRLVHGFIYRK